MRIYIYCGGLRFVRKSGVGQAISHQLSALEKAGISAVRRFDPHADIIHINTVFPDSLFMILLARIMRWKVVMWAHSTMEDFRGSFPFSDRLAPLFRRYITFCCNRADAVITPTVYSCRLITEYGVRRPVTVLSNGVDTGFFARNRNRGVYFRKKYGFCADDKIVVTAALPIERKGITEFIKLARRMNDVHFVWFGSLETILIQRKIKAAIAAAPSNVHFAGFVTQAELAGAYSGADCFLFMSREETEGIAVLEALSCSIPVVLRDIPAYSGLAEEGLDVCLFHTLDECEERVRHVLSHDMSAISEKERSLAKERDLSLIGQRLSEVYRQIVKREKHDRLP